MIFNLYKTRQPNKKKQKRLIQLRYKTIALSYIFILLGGCQSIDSYTRQLNQSHVKTNFLSSTQLPITAWIPKAGSKSDTLRLYIEGDGRAWVKRNKISPDPTPTNRLVHALILKDKKNDVAYIGRPCQFNKNSYCTPLLWTFARYDEQSIQAINEILDQIKMEKHYKKIELVGFSGGATIALLLASRRNDISSVRTVAGNLDPEYTNKLHQVSKMPTALNPSLESSKLQFIPQWHFIGTRDNIIKPSILSHYRSHFKNQTCINSTLVNGASHNSGWIDKWPKLLELLPACQQRQSEK